jgi:hypothetical protein
MNIKTSVIAVLLASAAQLASAANVTVSNDIVTSTTWEATNVYNITKQIYVQSGATLTIPAGTVCKSVAGSLAVCRGAKIYVNGTQNNPVIMTSTNDTMTSWREGANEWGNLTIMGKGLISASSDSIRSRPLNTKTPTGLNTAQMEGIVPLSTNAADMGVVTYGGNDDNDDSGSIHYLSLRYGGKVIGLADELNGLSLGGVGRATDIDHLEIMNNVDDGIEIWGGTVNMKYVSIWNIGDDSFDIDQGWRGKAQFGLVVQGYSVNAGSGSGVGDNCFEMDGAEDSDAQPVTTCAFYNFTTIGQPGGSSSCDHGAEFRDNARAQFRNCIWMDLGETLVKNQNVDGNGAQGYGFNGTLSFVQTWNTSATNYSAVNAGTWTNGAFNDPTVMYTAQQSDGMLAEFKDSVFYSNMFASAYTTADSVGVRSNGNNNVTATLMPIQVLQRGPQVIKTGLVMKPVTNINPCAANDAVTSVASAPNDGFYTRAPFRGGFSADNNWLKGWTAVDAYGMTTGSTGGNNSGTTTVQVAGANVSIFFPTTVGVVYTVEESTDLQNPNWTPVATVTGDGSIKSVADLVDGKKKNFYRAIVQ